jgi:predicted nucleotidyltransferase
MQTIAHDLLAEITRRLVAELQPEQVILFGSHAWGIPNEHSDIDLLVIVPENGSSVAEQEIRARRCLRGLGVPKDILVRTRAQVERFRSVRASLEAEILERGRILYG